MTQKEKAYDEALKKAVVAHKDEDRHLKATLERIFPELAESEDEKIRKELLQIAEESEDSFYMVMTPNKREKLIAWLEKQGEPTEINPTEFDTRLQNLIGQFDSLPKEELIDSINFWLNVVQNNGTYKEEKQDEQKSIDPDTLIQQRVDALADIVAEQKPTNKVEPKFNVDDCIISHYNHVAYIKSIDEKYYFLSLSDGNSVQLSINCIDKNWRLWTIQDARDGDVLTYNDSKNNVWVCIFKEYANERVYDYCTLDKESFWERGNWNYLASFSYTPATKEQRDLLLSKMKEAGYKWDAEKKELKKIEQKPAECNNSILKDKLLELFQRFRWYCKDEIPTNGDVIEYVDAHIQELIDTIQNKPWSEEDERERKHCIDFLNHPDLIKATPTIVDNCKNWLKSLRPQNRWKPSDEQMEALEHFIVYHNGSTNYAKDLEELRLQLKKLRED